jgi:hypothetical protein
MAGRKKKGDGLRRQGHHCDGRLQHYYPLYPENFTNKGGVLDFYTGGISSLLKGLSKEELTYQMSDHLPLWMQMNTDIAGFKPDQITQG